MGNKRGTWVAPNRVWAPLPHRYLPLSDAPWPTSQSALMILVCQRIKAKMKLLEGIMNIYEHLGTNYDEL